MAEASHWLKKILKDMHTIAAKIPGKPVRRELKGGLRIDILVSRVDGTTKLQLSRNYTWPSATEFAVVLNNLPYDIPLELEPERQIYSDRYYLRCQWPTPEAQA